MAESTISVLPHEIIIEILLEVPPKSLLKFMCVSQSWLELISSMKFIKNHLKLTANDKEYSHHRIIFQEFACNFKVCCLPSKLNKERSTELFDIGSPMENPTIYTWIAGSVNKLICLYSKIEETVLWNPVINKSKKLPTFGAKLRNNCSYYLKYGFGYDETRDDYKVVFAELRKPGQGFAWGQQWSPSAGPAQGVGSGRDIYEDSGSYDTVVNIYSLRADSWRTINKFQGNFLLNSPGKFVDGNLYWALSADVDAFNMCNITSLDLADETWRRLELPDSYGKGSYPLALGVVGSHLSVLCINCLEGTNSDVWIRKDCGVEVSWIKIFTVDHPKDLGEFIFFTSIFSVPCYQSNKDEILLLLPPIIMTYNGSTRQVEVVD
uniref:F-Box protein n=1 Tax=Solanum tuberosum TaxID=4113 RepID=M1C446_SOLTU